MQDDEIDLLVALNLAKKEKNGSHIKWILNLRKNDKILKYLNHPKLSDFSQKGPVTPDHVIRIKPKPLILNITNVKTEALDNIIEKEIISQICKLIGYSNDFGGTFPTGGSMGNFMALVMARDKKDLMIRNQGLKKRMIAYTSEESHYSNVKNASSLENATSTKSGRLNLPIHSENLYAWIKKHFIWFKTKVRSR